ncbi:transposase [Chitinophaga silvisoli]|uniref:Uncharacterized protein n=1 Tax=Chitinophaga silvisoli TaxID=2291814 RepID=A0A3E1P3G2_9BACT|nr:hypothetical protein DXN04_15730 [Chitinophaga silvisoli]
MGKLSAGVKRQYCGQISKTENCQVGVLALCAEAILLILISFSAVMLISLCHLRKMGLPFVADISDSHRVDWRHFK